MRRFDLLRTPFQSVLQLLRNLQRNSFGCVLHLTLISERLQKFVRRDIVQGKEAMTMPRIWKAWLTMLILWSLTMCPFAQAASEPNRFASMSDEQILRVAGVPRDHWAADAVIRLYRLGILQGYPQEQKAKPMPKKRDRQQVRKRVKG
jgi:hypothetical protein